METQNNTTTKEEVNTEEGNNSASEDAAAVDMNIPEDVKEFIEAGVHFGHKKSMVNPKMMPYIFGVRNGVHIINTTVTKEKLEEAIEYLKTAVSEGKTILFVGTRLPLREAVRETAEALNMPYLVLRWYGGTLTNWNSVSERVERFKSLRDTKNSSEWDKYPKHERLNMEREIEKLEAEVGGIQNMEKLPDVVFVADLQENEIAAQEAQKLDIPSVGIADTNVNPELLTYPIPANDDAVSSVSLILTKIRESLSKVKPKKKDTTKAS